MLVILNGGCCISQLIIFLHDQQWQYNHNRAFKHQEMCLNRNDFARCSNHKLDCSWVFYHKIFKVNTLDISNSFLKSKYLNINKLNSYYKMRVSCFKPSLIHRNELIYYFGFKYWPNWIIIMNYSWSLPYSKSIFMNFNNFPMSYYWNRIFKAFVTFGNLYQY